MSDFKHSISYYKDIVKQAKTTSRAAILPKSLTVGDTFTPTTKEQAKDRTKARVQVILRHHGAVLRALKHR